MARRDARRLIVNADDFGRSASINTAVIRAHREGILTTASLMVNEPACAEAVALAKENPKLGVGLHVALLHGRSALPPEKIPGLVNARGEFSNNPVAAGMKFFFQRELRAQIEAELAEQFARFRATGLRLDHVNGHLHIHLHPVVFEILMRRSGAGVPPATSPLAVPAGGSSAGTAKGLRQPGRLPHSEEWAITHFRFTRDPFWLNARLAGGAWLYRASHAVIYRLLSACARKTLVAHGIKFTPRVFGLLQNVRVDTAFVMRLLPRLPAGDAELYSHPSLDEFRHEFEALMDPKVKELVRNQAIELIRYQDL